MSSVIKVTIVVWVLAVEGFKEISSERKSIV